MVSFMQRLAVGATALAGFASAINNVQVKQQEFVDTVTNDRLMIIGVDYQPGGQSGFNPSSGVDPLSNGTVCLRDAALMQSLGINTIRTYNVDPDLNHDECASIFNEIGVYMIVDVNSPLANQSLDRTDPSGTYTLEYINRTFAVVEAFKNYPNTLGFFSGNEVINDAPSANITPPYIRAVQRDLKSYIAKNVNRTIPVGYSAADVNTPIVVDNWNYMQCMLNSTTVNGVDMSRSDFFGLNDYEWCGDSSYTSSGYNVLVEDFGSTTIPFFFSEYGCNQVSGSRPFTEVQALYGPNMTVLSGGLVYEFTNEVSGFGLVNVNSNGSVSILQDYMNLQSQYSKLNISLLENQNGTATSLQPPVCSPGLISDSGFSQDFDIPPSPSGVDDLIASGVPNANQGKIVAVTATAVPVQVFGVNGQPITGLSIHPGNGMGNTPGAFGNSTSGSGSGKKGAAVPGASVSVNAIVLSALMAFFWAL